MLVTFVIFLVLSVSLYLAISYRSWQIKKGLIPVNIDKKISIKQAVYPLIKKLEEQIKNGIHSALFFLGKTFIAFSEKVKKLTFKIFPKLKTMFEEKDKLTGLYHGPASFFLANVSEYKNTAENLNKMDVHKK